MSDAVGHALEEVGGNRFCFAIADANDATHGSFLAWASGGFLGEQRRTFLRRAAASALINQPAPWV
jgi:hypothetical protein